ncbi:glycerophosphodiester phosphodiesterase family protein [Marinimicrobium alkaliphilum]|uniref:glycerophosphodiester phosphodiesterase family protein n=1 Tax=Marinimicrobium alkaliphilum TaxID=2202654 RepID=UPI000DB9FE5D|nr:glycerophosphodiester phosphodiesterase family protein [Marinimicrobium alkaliphilum]
MSGTARSRTAQPQALWISHRGACATATENTAEAFRAARARGFTHLETDLRSTVDGELVLAHDRNLRRISDWDLDVCESTREQLAEVRLNGGEALLFFDQFLPEFADVHWIFDIKPEQGMRTLDTLFDWWQKPDWREFFKRRVRLLLWDKRQQQYLLERHPEAVCLASVSECRRAGVACLLGLPVFGGIEPGKTYALPPRLGGINLMRPAMIARFRRYGGRVLSYLPETEDDVRHSLAVGVDEVLTNHDIIE